MIVGRELDAVRLGEIVCNGLHDAGDGAEAVDLRRDRRLGAEVLPVAVARVRKPDVAGVRVLAHVVDGGEVAAQEGVQQDAGLVRCRVEEGQLGGDIEVAFVAEQYLLARTTVDGRTGRVVGRGAIAGGDVGVADGGEGVVGEVEDGDVDGVGEVADPVGGDVEGVGHLAVDAGFVEGFPGHVGDEGGGDVGAEDGGDEGGVVGEEVDVGVGVCGGVDDLLGVGEARCEV